MALFRDEPYGITASNQCKCVGLRWIAKYALPTFQKKASETAGSHQVVTHNGAEKAGSPD